MSAYGDNPTYHAIAEERFVCTAPADALCRTSPTCECENWCCCDGSPEDAADNHDTEHCCMTTAKTGQGCWIEPWVNASDLEDCYEGDPLAVWTYDADDEHHWPDGPVTCDWEDEYVAWSYATGSIGGRA